MAERMTEAAAPAARSRRRRIVAGSPHSGRFRVVTGVLVGLAVAAIVIAVALAVAGRSPRTQTAAWSTWSPPDSGAQGAGEIASYVAPFYRATAADQLAVVTVVNLQSQAAIAAAAQAQANGTTTGTSSGGLEVAVRANATSSAMSLLSGNTIAYNLCGIGGKNCAIVAGKASTNRLLLLRREALELAMYTFKYIGGTQNVVAILPPGHMTQTSTLSKTLPTSDGSGGTRSLDMAVLFQRQELAPLLAHPLSATLPETSPPNVDQIADAPEAQLVSEVTARGLFSEKLQQAQDGTSLIVLDPLPPQ